MQKFPHHYTVTAKAESEGEVIVSAEGLDTTIVSSPPKQFGGSGDAWSPEDLLVGAIADCFTLSFRAIAHASKFPWIALNCDVTGVLDRVDGVTKFTEYTVNAHLTIAADTDEDKAKRLLEKAESACLITNSMTAESHLNVTVVKA